MEYKVKPSDKVIISSGKVPAEIQESFIKDHKKKDYIIDGSGNIRSNRKGCGKS